MNKYAIVEVESGEFYPDPIYTNIKKIKDKINYLINYRKKNGMEERHYKIEKLTKEREKQHNEEWKRWCSLID